MDLLLLKNVLGYATTVLRIVLFMPQLWLVFSKRDASGLSTLFLSIGLLLSLVSGAYGALLEEPPMIIASSVAFLCVLAMLIAKCFWPNGQKKEFDEASETELAIPV